MVTVESRKNLTALLLAIAYICAGPLTGMLPYPLRLTVDGVVALGLFIFIRRIGDMPKLGIKAPWAILFILGAVTLAVILGGLWLDLMTSAQPAQKAVIEAGKLPSPDKAPLLTNFAAHLFGPITEEIIYRLAILGSLARLIGKAPALLISSVIFSAVHADVYPPVMLIPLFISGVLHGITFLLLGLPWAIAMHIINNSRPLLALVEIGDVASTIIAILAIAGLWVFLSRTIKLRRMVFGGS